MKIITVMAGDKIKELEIFKIKIEKKIWGISPTYDIFRSCSEIHGKFISHLLNASHDSRWFYTFSQHVVRLYHYFTNGNPQA